MHLMGGYNSFIPVYDPWDIKKCMAYNGKNILWPTGHKKVCHNIVVWFRHYVNQYDLFVWTKFIHNKCCYSMERKIFQVLCQRIWNQIQKVSWNLNGKPTLRASSVCWKFPPFVVGNFHLKSLIVKNSTSYLLSLDPVSPDIKSEK